MIVRIMGEGQVILADGHLAELNKLDDELLASGALDDQSGMHKDDIQAELDRLSGGTDVELELQRMKAELAGGPSGGQQAIEGGNQSQQSQQQPQDTPRFDKQ